MKRIEFKCCRFDELSNTEIYTILAARAEVFIVEQNCPYQDIDSYDLVAWHLTGWSENNIAAYLRIVDPGHKYTEPSIGRVITTKNFRGVGVGRILMTTALQQVAKEFPRQAIRISAQLYLQKFYESFGFKCVSETYLEDNIPHIEMLHTP